MSVRILTGDCREMLRTIPGNSVDMACSSPPYFNLRDYGIDGQLGLEQTHTEYVSALADVFEEVRRVLKPTGSLWLNLGDSYAGSWGAQSRGSESPGTLEGTSQLAARQIAAARRGANRQGSSERFPGLKPKDLIGIPWRVAFALQERGWWLRGDHVWGKPNGMPESTEDRPTRGHEYVFLLTKSARYFYNGEAVRTAPKASTITRLAQDVEAQEGSERANGGAKTNGRMKAVAKRRGHARPHEGFDERWDSMSRDEQMADGGALRSVWWVPPAQFSEAHFAVMPDRVAEICIRAGCPEGGTVLDPFGGAGTVGLVADRLQRNAILIELNPEYAEMARRRIERDAPMFADVSAA